VRPKGFIGALLGISLRDGDITHRNHGATAPPRGGGDVLSSSGNDSGSD
jgi:hypothetical protein